MHTAFLAPDSPRWRSVLEEIPHDLYHLPDYVSFASRRQEPGMPLAFLAEEGDRQFLVPLIVRSAPPIGGPADGLLDATCPRDYPGPLLTCGAHNDLGDFPDRAVLAFRDGLRERHIVAAYIRLHPLFTVPLDVLSQIGVVVEHQSSVSIDLTLSRDELWAQTRHNHRRAINRATKRGYIARHDPGWDGFGGFFDAYRETMFRVGATDVWSLPADYFLELRQLLGERLHLWVVDTDGKVMTAALFSEVCGIVEYLFSGTRDEFVGASPGKALINAVRWWAKERGNRVLHLGGSTRKGDALFLFKTGFSSALHSVASWRVVADEPAYRRRVEQWEVAQREKADGPTGFFPSYRKTPVRSHPVCGLKIGGLR